MIVNRCLLYVFVRVELRFPLYLPPTAVLGTAFAIFLICRLSSALYLWPHFLFFAFVDYLRAILVTAFTIFPICRLSLLYTCDCIRTFFHLQIIFPSEPVTAFTIILICRLSLLYTCDCIRIFSHFQIISPPNQWPHSQFFPFADYPCAIPPLRLCLGMLTGRINPCMDNEYSRGLRREMQASFRHQAHCLSDSEFGRLADNRRMQRVANAAVLQVHTRDKPTVTPHHIHSYNAYLRPFFSCFRIPPGGLFSPSILLK